MKKLGLILLGAVSAINIANAQSRYVEEKGPSHVIKTNVLPMLTGQIPFTNEYRLVYEQRTGQRTSVQITGAYLGKSPFVGLVERYAINAIDEDIKLGVSGFRTQLALKFYILNKQPSLRGFYLAPNLSVAHAKITNKNNSNDYFKATYSSASALAGYQFIIGNHFAIDVFTGIGVKYNHYGVNIPVEDSNFEFNRLNWVGPKFWLGFNMGYAF